MLVLDKSRTESNSDSI